MSNLKTGKIENPDELQQKDIDGAVEVIQVLTEDASDEYARSLGIEPSYHLHAFIDENGEACGYAIERTVIGMPHVDVYARAKLTADGGKYIERLDLKDTDFAQFGLYQIAYKYQDRYGGSKLALFCCLPVQISNFRSPMVLTRSMWERSG